MSSNMLSPENKKNMPLYQVKRVWKELHAGPELCKRLLRPEIYDSWKRSYHYNVKHDMQEIAYTSPKHEFRKALENSKYLMETAIPVMERLSEFVKGSGFVVILSDANCVVLKIIGDKESIDWSKRSNVVEGTIWTEEKVGTNSGQLCISLVKPISIYSYEHFCLFAITGASSFAPIVDNGRVIGSIGMAASYEKVSYHTLGMVVAAADHIQSTMMLNRIFKYHQVITDSMSDGVMVVDVNGNITYINKKCSKILGLKLTGTIEANIHNIFGDNPKNKFFINSVTQGRTITDNFLVLYYKKKQINCYITCTPLHSSNPTDMGSVIIIRESERINSIVGKWIGRSAKMTFNNIIGNNLKFQEIINIAKITSQSDSNVLLLGESGTGKDVIAQAIHNESPRKNNPFIAINCAALPRELIASELFGYEDGAFTGAKKGGNVGKFELANQGTLFLDEIGDVPLDLQVSLLRVLEEKSVIRLGGSKLIPVNVRIVAATNKDLEEEISRNIFRRDLYYRLGVIRLIIPPLRERKDDIPLLIEHFLGLICKRFGKPPKRLSPQAMSNLINYAWPGNIRELQNLLESAIQLTLSEEIDCSFIADYLGLKYNQIQLKNNRNSHLKVLSSEEQLMLEDILIKNKYNKSKTAKELGISRQCLYRKLHKYNLLT
ncbi:sigma 54-interacting transcriptional regulator [Desulfoscipio sp. XC116]|uniref:sigma-54-dependent Fis family transcriptional regulator n=1 Tax=Desulfoscipio sp. XC116 TaxID=3144975 RepID=UPI00325A4510